MKAICFTTHTTYVTPMCASCLCGVAYWANTGSTSTFTLQSAVLQENEIPGSYTGRTGRKNEEVADQVEYPEVQQLYCHV